VIAFAEVSMQQLSALVQRSSRLDFERRLAERHASSQEALTRPLHAADALAWGATVRDISATGVKTMLTRVIHAHDLADGTWHVGCEFVKSLSEAAWK
jgi:hypothetical protein